MIIGRPHNEMYQKMKGKMYMNKETNNKEKKLLSPKLDVVFQALFGEEGNEEITKGFLEAILKEKIEKIDLSKNVILRREFKEDKLGILDILAELDGNKQVNIELQLIDKNNTIERMLYYWSRLYSRKIRKGGEYQELPKTIVILISNFRIKELGIEDYYTKWQIMEATRKIVLTEKLELYIIELPNIIGKENKSDKLLDWLYFLENPKSERVEKNMGENKELKRAVKELNKISEDEKMQRIAELREKAILDEKAIYARGFDVGEEKGRQEGREEGRLEGRLEGRKEEKIEIAKELLKESFPTDKISKITGLTEEEIENLKNM